MFNDCKYKLGDIVLYNNNRYRIKKIHGCRKNPYMTYVSESEWKYEYDLVLDREPREGELTIVRGVDERAIKCMLAPQSNKTYFPGYKFDPKFMENMYPVKRKPLYAEALEELNKREFERIAASPIRIDIDDAIKANYSKEEIKKMINNTFGVPKFEYKKIIFNGPATIILWKDGTKTMAKASSGKEVFDPEKGVAICFMKKMLGHTETNKVLRKANKDYYDEIVRKVNRQLDEELKKATFPLPEGVTFRPFNFDAPVDNNKIIKVEEKGDN